MSERATKRILYTICCLAWVATSWLFAAAMMWDLSQWRVAFILAIFIAGISTIACLIVTWIRPRWREDQRYNDGRRDGWRDGVAWVTNAYANAGLTVPDDDEIKSAI